MQSFFSVLCDPAFFIVYTCTSFYFLVFPTKKIYFLGTQCSKFFFLIFQMVTIKKSVFLFQNLRGAFRPCIWQVAKTRPFSYPNTAPTQENSSVLLYFDKESQKVWMISCAHRKQRTTHHFAFMASLWASNFVAYRVTSRQVFYQIRLINIGEWFHMC